MTTDNMAEIDFCSGCFASGDDSSWGGVIVDGYCTNCGMPMAVKLPRWAVDSIRRQASWVGKRYYPTEEDEVMAAELKVLRPLMPDHETDVWEIIGETAYTLFPDGPRQRLSLRRSNGNASVRSVDMYLPDNHTDNDLERAKMLLRSTIPISWHYRNDSDSIS